MKKPITATLTLAAALFLTLLPGCASDTPVTSPLPSGSGSLPEPSAAVSAEPTATPDPTPTPTPDPTPTPTQTPDPWWLSPEATGSDVTRPLTEGEVAYFNGPAFFNGEKIENFASTAITNQFLASLYDEPGKVNLYELFYNGADPRNDEVLSEDEKEALKHKSTFYGYLSETGEWVLNYPIFKTSRAAMNEVLMKYMGISLDETDKSGLPLYLEEFDAYYTAHGDENIGDVTFTGGEITGNMIRLVYNDDLQYGRKGYTVTLKVQDGRLLFVSNVAN